MNAPRLVNHLSAPFGMQNFSYVPSFGVLSTYPPTACGLATFSAALASGLGGERRRCLASFGWPMAPSTERGPSRRGARQRLRGSIAASEFIERVRRRGDPARVRHLRRPDGDEVIEIIRRLRVPSIVVLHTVLTDPTHISAASSSGRGQGRSVVVS